MLELGIRCSRGDRSWMARLIPTPPIGDIACAASQCRAARAIPFRKRFT